VPDEVELLLQNSSLSEEQKETWTALSAAVATAAPISAGQKGPPSPEVLAALQAARAERNAFLEALEATQKEELMRILEIEKRERKAMLKAVAKQMTDDSKGGGNSAPLEDAATKERKKDIMRQAFWLYQQDRQKELGTSYVDSTEWKRIRALGGENPTLCHYLKRAGWDKSWALPEPEGRAFRREQHAKVKAEKGK